MGEQTTEAHVEIVNDVGSSVIGLERTPKHDRFLTVAGERVYDMGWDGCDTCRFVFERLVPIGGSQHVSGAQVAALLSDLHRLPELSALRGMASVLPYGRYSVLLHTTHPRKTRPGEPLDYFANEGEDLWGPDPGYGVPHNPKVAYYRLGEYALPVADPPGTKQVFPLIPHPGLLADMAIPLQPRVYWRGRDTLARYEADLSSGKSPTVFALAVLDVRSPWSLEGVPETRYGKHYLFAEYVVDGHHKLEAATRGGQPIQFLSFLLHEATIAAPDQIAYSLRALAGKVGRRLA